MKITSLLLLTASLLWAQGPADVQLKAAMHLEQVRGDLPAAIAAYRKIIAGSGQDRATTARAKLQLAICHERLGQAEARKLYEDLSRNYADQPSIAAEARRHLGRYGKPTAALALRKLDINSEQACFPWNVSLDGKWLGAVEYKTGNMALIDAQTGECRALTNWGTWNTKNGTVDQGAISRDGRWLASWHYDGASDGEIRIVGADGAGLRTIYTRRKANDWFEWGIPTDWSPDGKYILVQFEHGSQLQVGTNEFAAVSVADGSVRVLQTLPYSARYRPRFLYSPDGRHIAWDYPVTAGSSNSDLYLMPATGGPGTAIAASEGRETLAGWTASGDLVFFSDRSGRNALYRLKMREGKAAGQPEILRADIGEWAPIGITANGALFYRERLTHSDAFIAPANPGGGARPLLDRYPGAGSVAAWSQDGAWLAIHRLTPDRDRATFVIRNVASGKEREIVTPIRIMLNRRLLWSPNGRALLLMGASTQGDGLHRVDLADGAATILATGRDIEDFTPDGNLLVRMGTNRHMLLLEDRQTGQTRTLVRGTKVHRRIAISPDGKKLTYVENLCQIGAEPCPMFILDIASGAKRQIDSAFYNFGGADLTWSADGQRLLMTRSDKPRTEFGLHLLSLGEPQSPPVLIPGTIGVNNPAISPDGKSILWRKTRIEESAWAMENFLPAN
jgi:Tol biopolymer transport system component